MENMRKYGDPPFNVVVLHGGPGAPGELTPVATKLSSWCGVLESLQTKSSIKGLLKELKSIIDKNSKKPVTLIGWSFGAWLAFIFSAQYQNYVKRLILVGSGPFEERYATQIMETRLSRLSKSEKKRLKFLLKWLSRSNNKDKQVLMKQFENIVSKADSFQLIRHKNSMLEFQPESYQKVWEEASELRRSNKLIAFAKEIRCPVVAIHGDYDPHPLAGVKIPLSKSIKSFRFILLKNCGHRPWLEKSAKVNFFEVLRKEIG